MSFRGLSVTARLNSLSIDVEEWFHPELVRERVAPQERRTHIETSLAPLVRLLDRYNVKATFFFLGEVAAGHRELVQRLHDEGHEIACHGMSHLPLGGLGRTRFREELEAFTDLMRQTLGDVRIRGFRAPTFSLNSETAWALPLLSGLGFEYDASLFPARIPGNDLYGVRGAPRSPYHVSFDDFLREDPQNPFIEFPNTVLFLGGIPVPLAGGFYLRVIPSWVLAKGLERVNRSSPFNLYIHPWETDPQTPRVPLDWKSRWITYHGIDSALAKLEFLLGRFAFSRVDRVLACHLQSVMPH